LRGIDNISQARELVGLEALVAEEELNSLPEDDYYFFLLQGFRVETREGRSVGHVMDVLSVPGSDLLVVASESGREILVPFVRAICVEVNVPDKRLVIDPPAGLLDLNEI